MVSCRPTVHIDLARVRENVIRIARQTGVPVIAVIKSDAYGLGAGEVVGAIGDLVSGFYSFSFEEAVAAGTARTGKSCICLTGDASDDPQVYRDNNVRPAVWDADRARAWRAARPVLAVDTGMQRFACPREQIDDVIHAGACDEAFTHAVRSEQARMLHEWLGGRGLRLHAAASELLHIPDAWLDAVRPGLALYRDAVRVIAPLVEARDSRGPVGYRGHAPTTGRHGVIVAGYNGLRPGPCIVNEQPRRIFECGMQSSYVELGPHDRAGDPVVLLGDGLDVEQLAVAWKSSPQEALFRMASCGRRVYSNLR
jgi:alanine racemase